MPTIRVPPGVVRAETENMAQGRWTDANLIRWVNGVMAPVGGHERITKDPLQHIPRANFVWLDDEQNRYQATLCDDAVFRSIEGGYENITPADFLDANRFQSRGYGSGLYGVGLYGSDEEPRGEEQTGIVTGGFNPYLKVRYSLDNWNRELLFSSSGDGRLFVYDPKSPKGTKPTVVEGAPTFIRDMLVTEEHHVMCFGADGFPNRVAWSDQNNRNGWDYTRVEGQAGFFDLEGAGQIVHACKVPGAILVFTSTSVWIGRYIGLPYYYGFTKAAEGCVPISPQSVAVAGSRVFWMGTKSFFKYEGGIVSPLPHTLGTGLFDNIAEVAPRRVCAGFNGQYPEVWFFYPTIQDGAPIHIENDKYVVFCFDPGREWWADGELSRTCYSSSPIDGYPIAGSDQTHLYKHETGYTNEGATRAGLVFATVGGLSFGDGDAVYSVHQAQVDNATGAEAVEFDFRGQYVRGGPTYDLQMGVKPQTDGFLPTHFAARDFSMTIRGVRDEAWGMGALIFDKVVRKSRK